MKSREVEHFMPRGERCNSLSIKGNLANHLQGAGFHAAKRPTRWFCRDFWRTSVWLSTAQPLMAQAFQQGFDPEGSPTLSRESPVSQKLKNYKKIETILLFWGGKPMGFADHPRKKWYRQAVELRTLGQFSFRVSIILKWWSSLKWMFWYLKFIFQFAC